MNGVSLAGFRAGGDRRVVVRPVAPRAGVKASIWPSGQLHGQEVVAGVSPGASVHHGALLGPEAGEAVAQLLTRFEAPVGAEVLHPRRAERPRDVACLGVDGLVFAAVALAGPRVEQRGVLE